MLMSASPSVLQFSDLSPVITGFLARYGFESNCSITLAGAAGSRRFYWRLRQGLRRLIVLQSPPDDADFGRFLRITQFYRLVRFPVPMVYCIDDAAHQVVLEDLGERRLFDLVVAARSTHAGGGESESVIDAYRKAVDLLIDLQTRCQALHQECPDIRSRLFDREQLLWETAYFRVQYLEGYRQIAPTVTSGLQSLFEGLADKVDNQPKAVMHRDYQSQNLMAASDGILHVIDYQGSRLGSIYYDLASLLLDPYIGLEDGAIDELLRYYHTRSLHTSSFEVMRGAFLLAGMQRVMQALGAYCFLSRVKGISSFAEHITPGEQRLRWLIAQAGGGEWQALLPQV
jgi:N-acetylmuramate 1-kinase